MEIIRKGKKAQILQFLVPLHFIPTAKAFCYSEARHTSKEKEVQSKAFCFPFLQWVSSIWAVHVYASSCRDSFVLQKWNATKMFLKKLNQKKKQIGFFFGGLRFSTRTFSSSILYDTLSNVDPGELTHCQKA